MCWYGCWAQSPSRAPKTTARSVGARSTSASPTWPCTPLASPATRSWPPCGPTTPRHARRSTRPCPGPVWRSATATTAKPIVRNVDHGLYRLGPEVVTDLALLEAAVALGEPVNGLIVGGTPFAEPEGYEWAYLEGHAPHAAALIEQASEARTR